MTTAVYCPDCHDEYYIEDMKKCPFCYVKRRKQTKVENQPPHEFIDIDAKYKSSKLEYEMSIEKKAQYIRENYEFLWKVHHKIWESEYGIFVTRKSAKECADEKSDRELKVLVVDNMLNTVLAKAEY